MADMHVQARLLCKAWEQHAPTRRDENTTKITGRVMRSKGNARIARPVLSSLATVSIWLTLFAPPALMAMRIPKAWNEEPACAMVRDPEWPFVYSKYRTQKVRDIMTKCMKLLQIRNL